MNKIHDIDELEPHLTGELVCLNCYYRYIGTWNEKVWLRDLECPQCHQIGGIIGTGQIMVSHYDSDRPNPMPQSKPGQLHTFPGDKICDISGQKVNNIIKLNQRKGEEE